MDELWHYDVLAAIFRAIRGESVLEFGVGSWSKLREMCDPKEYVGVDSDPACGAATHIMTTDAFFEATAMRTFDLILVDADHAYTQARKDLVASMQILSERGIIAVHDTFPAAPEFLSPTCCHDSWRLLRDSFPGWSSFTLCVHPGLTFFSRTPNPQWDQA